MKLLQIDKINGTRTKSDNSKVQSGLTISQLELMREKELQELIGEYADDPEVKPDDLAICFQFKEEQFVFPDPRFMPVVSCKCGKVQTVDYSGFFYCPKCNHAWYNVLYNMNVYHLLNQNTHKCHCKDDK